MSYATSSQSIGNYLSQYHSQPTGHPFDKYIDWSRVSQFTTTTGSGRSSVPPERYSAMTFVAGSGAAPRKGYDGTDMRYSK